MHKKSTDPIIENDLFNKVKRRLAIIPYLNLLGITLQEAGEGWVKMKMIFRSDFLQPSVIHGGAIYSLADTAAANALLTLIPENAPVATIEQNIKFIKGTKDQDLYCYAKIIQLGKTIAFAEASITTETGILVARSSATLMRLNQSDGKI